MMTKIDFQIIAAAFRSTQPQNRAETVYRRRLAQNLAVVLSTQNALFMEDVFLTACSENIDPLP